MALTEAFLKRKMNEYEALRVEIESLNQELSDPHLFYRQEDKIKAQLKKKIGTNGPLSVFSARVTLGYLLYSATLKSASRPEL
jgi:hypothetical protein